MTDLLTRIEGRDLKAAAASVLDMDNERLMEFALRDPDIFRHVAEGYLSALLPQPAVPEGWRDFVQGVADARNGEGMFWAGLMQDQDVIDRMGDAAVALLAASPSPPAEAWDDPNKADLWWVEDDPETGFNDAEDAYDHGNGCGPDVGIVRLMRANKLPDVWATHDGKNVVCFHTEAEADAFLAALPTPPKETD